MEVKLRYMTAKDLPLTFAWRNRDDVRCWFFHSDLITWDQHEDWWYTRGQFDEMFIIEAEGEACGQVALYNWNRGWNEIEFGRMMIGVDRFRGNGVGLAAVRQTLHIAFYYHSLTRVFLRVKSTNERAIGIYRAAGFRDRVLDREIATMEIYRP